MEALVHVISDGARVLWFDTIHKR